MKKCADTPAARACPEPGRSSFDQLRTNGRSRRAPSPAVVLLTIAVLATSLSAWAQLDSGVPPAPPGRSSTPAKAFSSGQLLAELRKGGYLLYFRHTATDFSRDDARSRSDDDCANQRPLTNEGRAQARAIGAAMRELGIPLGKVLASPRCRTMETAMLAFGRAEPSAIVRGGPARPENADRYSELRTLLSTPVERGRNVIIASHGNPFFGVAGPPYLAEGEAAVLRPLGKDFEVVARIKVGDWAALE